MPKFIAQKLLPMLLHCTPLATLQEMGGWETPSMVQRYAHLAPEHLHKHSALFNYCLL